MNVLHFFREVEKGTEMDNVIQRVKVTKYMEREGGVEIVDNTLSTKDF